MRIIAVLGALGLMAASTHATAQVQVSAQTERSNYLLYERVDVLVTIQNIGDSDVVLNNDEGHPWLSFIVSKHNHVPVRPERSSDFEPLTLKVGESKTLKVNITPLFSFRNEDDYKVAAVVDLPGQGQVMSAGVPFTVLNGYVVWTVTRPVDGIQRVYSLIRFSPKLNTTALYLRVESPADNTVYSNIALGTMVSSIDPDVQFDPAGNIHVLQPVALGTYLYTRADSDGKVLAQRIFKTFHEIPPRLAKIEDGNVLVAGGLAEDPNAPRERLSDAQNGKQAPPASSLQ
jgi:hypothetical protein